MEGETVGGDRNASSARSGPTKFRERGRFNDKESAFNGKAKRISPRHDNLVDVPGAFCIVPSPSPIEEQLETVPTNVYASVSPWPSQQTHTTALSIDIEAYTVDDDENNVPPAPTPVVHINPKTAVVDNESKAFCGTRKIKYAIIAFVIAGLVALIISLVVTIDTSSSSSPQQTIPNFQPATASPTPKPFIYTQSEIAPNSNKTFDHLEFYGFLPTNQSNIDKIRQIRIYTNVICPSDDDCPGTVISLVTTYVLNNCTITPETNGFLVESGNLEEVINLQSDVYVTRIELFTQRFVTHMRICTSLNECYGPYGSMTDMPPTTVFEKENSVIKALYGYSGSWLDAMGVYYEDVGVSESTCS